MALDWSGTMPNLRAVSRPFAHPIHPESFMKKIVLLLFFIICSMVKAQTPVDWSGYRKKNGTSVTKRGNSLEVNWPTVAQEKAKLVINLDQGQPLFTSVQVSQQGTLKEIASALQPAFVLTIGKRDLISQNGWNIFFDKTNKRPHQSYAVELNKQSASVRTAGSRAVIRVGTAKAATFNGAVEITVYQGSPLFNVAAVMATEVDSTAILYDAGLTTKKPVWNAIAWSDTEDKLQRLQADLAQPAKAQAVKYRT